MGGRRRGQVGMAHRNGRRMWAFRSCPDSLFLGANCFFQRTFSVFGATQVRRLPLERIVHTSESREATEIRRFLNPRMLRDSRR